ncbi:MAG: 6,7-dimethyl-8-ribityllumazine synthase [Acidimicrobiales bacterium]
MRIAVVCARFNGEVTGALLTGALAALEQACVDRNDITVVWVPGSLELPLVAQALCSAGRVDAVVCLGAVVRGETAHFDLVAQGAAQGIARVNLDCGVPVIFGVLATENIEQAKARSLPDETNKGREAALGAVAMASVLRSLPQTLGPRHPGARC